MIHYMFLLMLGNSSYSAIQAHQDSMFLYKTHKESIAILENSTEVFALDEKLMKASESALLRLSTFNKETYEPTDERNKEGVGVAFAYPEPSPFAPVQKTIAPDEPPVAFKVLDRQTRFMVGKNGKTTLPYVLMNYYAKGRILVKSEKLNPVTFEVIQSEDAVTASN